MDGLIPMETAVNKALLTSLILVVSATLAGCAVYTPSGRVAYVGPVPGPSYAYMAPAATCVDSFGYSYRC